MRRGGEGDCLKSGAKIARAAGCTPLRKLTSETKTRKKARKDSERQTLQGKASLAPLSPSGRAAARAHFGQPKALHPRPAGRRAFGRLRAPPHAAEELLRHPLLQSVAHERAAFRDGEGALLRLEASRHLRHPGQSRRAPLAPRVQHEGHQTGTRVAKALLLLAARNGLRRPQSALLRHSAIHDSHVKVQEATHGIPVCDVQDSPFALAIPLCHLLFPRRLDLKLREPLVNCVPHHVVAAHRAAAHVARHTMIVRSVARRAQGNLGASLGR